MECREGGLDQQVLLQGHESPPPETAPRREEAVHIRVLRASPLAGHKGQQATGKAPGADGGGQDREAEEQKQRLGINPFPALVARFS